MDAASPCLTAIVGVAAVARRHGPCSNEPAMRPAFFVRALSFLAGLGVCATALVTGCSDKDPNFGPPGAIYNANYTPIPGNASSSTTSGSTSGGTPTDPKAAFAAVFEATKATCGGCHANATTAGNKPENVFFAPAASPTVDETYAIFKKAGNDFHKDKATNRFYNVAGGHPGPALTPAQKQAMDAWIGAEAGGGGATDAGGGG